MIDLPETLLLPVAEEKDGSVELLKATHPDGRTMPIAFTSLEALRNFALATGMASDGKELQHLEIPARSLLDQLIAADEPEICIDPMQENETILQYNRRGAVSRQVMEDGASMEVRKPETPLPDKYLEQLREVAVALPTVEAIWLMELEVRPAEADAEVTRRPLLVVRQSVGEDDDAFHEAFMELGDRWCETLPRGIGVDMLPHDAPPVKEHLEVSCLVYERK